VHVRAASHTGDRDPAEQATPAVGHEPRGPKYAISGRHVAIGAAAIVLLCAGGALVGALAPNGPSHRAGRTAVTEAPTISAPRTEGTGLAAYMGITRPRARPAPDFSLEDQRGADVSLRALSGEAVVLTFLDDRCSALCPALPEELRAASGDLGSSAGHVVFVAVNVDAASPSPQDLARFSAAHGLDMVDHWTFLTGSRARLAETWNAYHVSVEHGRDGELAYTGVIYFISPSGMVAYRATPYADETPQGTGTLTRSSVARWGKGIARYARSLLTGGHG
jgi:cytochrome oxidase Cu insertion factor (SCO1/SenC/PrrC family)